MMAVINKDVQAPIFTMADCGLKANLFVTVPELAAALSGTYNTQAQPAVLPRYDSGRPVRTWVVLPRAVAQCLRSGRRQTCPCSSGSAMTVQAAVKRDRKAARRILKDVQERREITARTDGQRLERASAGRRA